MNRSLGDIVANTKTPLTVSSLAEEFKILGVRPGTTLLCHCSLSSFGWVNGGAQAVIEALRAALGKNGTLVMPTHSPDLSNPALWTNPPVPEEWWQEICATMPAWDRFLTPSNGMGAVAETFRKGKKVHRSNHPHFSFAAAGKHALYVCKNHPLDFGLGEGSPLSRLYKKNASILMLGCDWASCTAFHLAEYRSTWPWKKEQPEFAPLRERQFPFFNATYQWQRIRNWNISSADFAACGLAFEAYIKPLSNQPAEIVLPFKRRHIGNADCRLANLRLAVDFAQTWIPNSRATAIL